MPSVETTRQMSEEERALLHEPPTKLFDWWTGLVSAACGFALTFLVVLLAAGFLPYAAVVRGAVAAATLVSLALYMWIQRRERIKLQRQIDLVAREGGAECVKSAIYAIRDAVAVEEFEDEGLSYFLLLDDGRTLFLSGQYLYGPAEKGFPWASFEVVRVAHGGVGSARGAARRFRHAQLDARPVLGGRLQVWWGTN